MATVTLSPTSGATGAQVQVSGDGFGRKAAGDLAFGLIPVGSFRTAGSGRFTASFSVPAGVPVGRYPVTATAGGVSSSTTFAVTSTPAPAPAPTPTPSGAVTINPGDDVQAKLNGAPAGSTFQFAAGVYTPSATIIVPSYSTLLIASGVVFDGRGQLPTVIRGYGGDAGHHDVTITGPLEVRNCTEPTTPIAAINFGWRWTVDGLYAHNNAGKGVGLNDDTVLRNFRIVDNGRYGFSAGPGGPFTIEDGELANNNTRQLDPWNDAGACKIIHARGLTVRRVHSHHNYGMGLWDDWDNDNVLYDHCVVHDNAGMGIFHEASGRCRISYCDVRNNGSLIAGKSIWNGADIFINDSFDTEVDHNTVVAGVHGIGASDQYRDPGSTPLGPLAVRNWWVHDNDITLPTATAACGMAGNRPEAFDPSSGNRWENNHYHVTDLGARHWRWNVDQTWAEWRAGGRDIGGTLVST